MSNTENTPNLNIVPRFEEIVDGPVVATHVTIAGVTMTNEQFRAARAGLTSGVGNQDEQGQLRDMFGLPHLQRRAYQISKDHGFHETDEQLDGLIAEGHDVIDRGRDFVIPAEHVADFVTLLQELRDAYRGNRLMLISGEVSEAHEELRSGHGVDETYFPELVDPDGLHNADGLDPVVRSKKPEGVPVELADVLIRLLDTAESWGIDLQSEVDRKMKFNEGRPAKHGRRF